MSDLPILYGEGEELHMPGGHGTTRAVANNRTCNVRLAMRAAQEAMGAVSPGDTFETIAYPTLGVVLVRRAG